MAPVNKIDINNTNSKAFIPAKKVLPEVETDGANGNGNGNGNSVKGYVRELLYRVYKYSVIVFL